MSIAKELIDQYEKKPDLVKQQHPLNKSEFQPQIPFTPQPRYQPEPSYLQPYQAAPQMNMGGWGGQQSLNNQSAINGFTPWSEEKVANLQSRLQKRLGPEYISSRSAGGGGKVSYLEAWKALALANEVFGFNGWSSSIISLRTDFMDIKKETKNGKQVDVCTCNVTAIVRITLRDGAYHEDVGAGTSQNIPSKAQALDKAQKEAVTDAVKRALRNFGNVLGNCLYDNNYTSQISKIKVPVAKYNVNDCERRPEFTPAGASIPSPVPAQMPNAGPSKPTAIPNHMQPNNNYRPSPLAGNPHSNADYGRGMSPETPLRAMSEADGEEMYFPPEDSFDAEFGYGDEEYFGTVEDGPNGDVEMATTEAVTTETPMYNHRQRPEPIPVPPIAQLTTASNSTSIQQLNTRQANAYGQRGPMQKSISTGETSGVQARGSMQRSISGNTALPDRSSGSSDCMNGGASKAGMTNGTKPPTNLLNQKNGAEARAQAIKAAVLAADASSITKNQNQNLPSTSTSTSATLVSRSFNRSESPKLPPGGVEILAAKVNTNSRVFKEAAVKLDLAGEGVGGEYGGFGSAARVKRSYEDSDRQSVSPSKPSRFGGGSRPALGEIQISPSRGGDKKPRW